MTPRDHFRATYAALKSANGRPPSVTELRLALGPLWDAPRIVTAARRAGVYARIDREARASVPRAEMPRTSAGVPRSPRPGRARATTQQEIAEGIAKIREMRERQKQERAIVRAERAGRV